MNRENCKACINEFATKNEYNERGDLEASHWDSWVPKRDDYHWKEGKVFCPAQFVEILPEYDLIGCDYKRWNTRDGYPPWCPHNGIAMFTNEFKEIKELRFVSLLLDQKLEAPPYLHVLKTWLCRQSS